LHREPVRFSCRLENRAPLIPKVHAVSMKGVVSVLRALCHRPADCADVLHILWLTVVQRRAGLAVERRAGIGDALAALACLIEYQRAHPGEVSIFVTARPLISLVGCSSGFTRAMPSDSAAIYLLHRFGQHIRYVAPTLPDETDAQVPRVGSLLGCFAKVLGTATPAPLRLTPPRSAWRRVTRRLKSSALPSGRFIVVHTGPTWPAREWTFEGWTGLLPRLREDANMPIVQVGSDRLTTVTGRTSTTFPGVIDWRERLSLLELLALLQHARLFVGIDSGPLHLALAAGAPTVCAWGSTSPETIGAAASDHVAVIAPVSCQGCHHRATEPRHWRTDCPRHLACMTTITPEAMLAACRRQLGAAVDVARSRPRPTPGGRLAYRLVFRPIARARRRLEHGAGAQTRAWLGERAMMVAAEKLAPLVLPTSRSDWPACRFLTGQRFWHQTVFCAQSLELAAGCHLPLEFFDDGTLGPKYLQLLRSVFPHARLVASAEIRDRIETNLPRNRFPVLHAIRGRVVLMRKLMDLRAGCTTPSLYFDSDMLFFSRPKHLLAWAAQPAGQLHMFEAQFRGYVLSSAQAHSLLGHDVRPNVNAGLTAIHDGRIDWEHFEWFCARLDDAQRRHTLIEQTLTALHFASTGAEALPADEYRLCDVLPDEPPPCVVLHYVNVAKLNYRTTEWRRWLAAAQASPRLAPVA